MDKTPEHWGAMYSDIRPTYVRFCSKVKELIEAILKSNGVDYFDVEERAKDVDSFVEKMQRDGKNYIDPLREVTDLAGARIICYYKEDVDAVANVIAKHFRVDLSNSVDKRELEDPDRFGYKSLHYVVTLAADRRDLIEWREFSSFKIEVQIRTVLQHAWAAIDHKLRYKTEAEVPKEAKRGLFRISALLETADDGFSTVRDSISSVRKKYKKEVGENNLDIPLDAESLPLFLTKSGMLARAADVGKHFGIRLLDNVSVSHAINALLQLSAACGLKSVKDFEVFASSAFSEAERVKEVCTYKNGEPLLISTYGIIRLLMSVKAYSTNPEALDASGLGPEIRGKIKKMQAFG